MKTKLIVLILLLIISLMVIGVYFIRRKDDTFLKKNTAKKTENIKTDSSKQIISNSNHKTKKKLVDTTVQLFFRDLSDDYNYKIIDKYYCNKIDNYYDTITREIKIFNKKDSLIQKINPVLQMTPRYFYVNNIALKTSRSYITGKNANYKGIDNYCGEIVVADLNFDGLEDFATPVDQGADNGPHYAYYIQYKKNKFVLNKYLTENLIWFPEKFNDSLKTMTNVVPCTVYGLNYMTFKYDTISKKWKKIKDYVIDIRTYPIGYGRIAS